MDHNNLVFLGGTPYRLDPVARRLLVKEILRFANQGANTYEEQVFFPSSKHPDAIASTTPTAQAPTTWAEGWFKVCEIPKSLKTLSAKQCLPGLP